MEVTANAMEDVGDKLIVVRKVPNGTKSGAKVSMLYRLFTSRPSLLPPKSNPTPPKPPHTQSSSCFRLLLQLVLGESNQTALPAFVFSGWGRAAESPP